VVDRKTSENKVEELAILNEDVEPSWSTSLFKSPKKKLRARWEQVSPSVKQTLERYSPTKLHRLFHEDKRNSQQYDGNMGTCSQPTATASHVCAKIVVIRFLDLNRV